MGNHHHPVPGQLTVQLQEVCALGHGAKGAKVSGPWGSGRWGGSGERGRGGQFKAGCAAGAMPPGAPVTQTRKCMAPLGFRPRAAGTTSQRSRAGTHFSMASMVLSSLSPDPVWGSVVGPWGWALPPPWPLPHHPVSPGGQPPSLPPSTSCPVTCSPTSVCPRSNIWPLDLPSLLSTYSPLSSLLPPTPSSPPRWAPRRRQKAGALGVCSRRGRRRKKMESTA